MCDSSFGLPYLLASKCVSSCGNGFYPNATNFCVECNQTNGCQTCKSFFECLSCIPTKKYVPSLFQCVDNCPGGSYFMEATNLCEACSQGCLLCSVQANNCSSCNSSGGYYITKIANSCTLSCDTTQQLFPDTLNFECVKCRSPCLRCTTAFDKCESCLTGSLYQESCLSICPAKMYGDAYKTCQSCKSPCANCESLTKCIDCNASYPYFYNNWCYAACPVEAPLAQGTNCVPCSGNCSQCLSLIECTKCVTNFFLVQGTCLACNNVRLFFATHLPSDRSTGRALPGPPSR